MGKLLSKSRYMTGLSCPKLLWYEWNDPERVPPHSAKTQANFEEGTKVGELARKRYPDGILVDAPFFETVKKTQELLLQRKPLFEASFQDGQNYCKVDLLIPDGKDGWELIEVKKSCSVKPEHIDDLAFQLFVVQSTGLNITGVKLLHVNKKYVRQGEIDVQEFFTEVDVEAEVRLKLAVVEENIKRIIGVVEGDKPEHEVVHVCANPYSCLGAQIDCGPEPEFNLSQLYWGKAKGKELIQQGIILFQDLPDDFTLTDKQSIQKEAVLTRIPHIDEVSLKNWLERLEFPLFFFDFETFGGAIPPLDGMKPYSAVPFQFSLHIQRTPESELEHVEFLAAGGDPRKDIIQAMKVLEEKGSIVAYNASYEIGCIKDLQTQFPEEKWLGDLVDRFWDLMEPFKQFWYYHPFQKGSYSLKYVLPALTGITYDELEIQEGAFASREYVRITTTDVTPEEKERVRQALLKYCEQDTIALVEVLAVLKESLHL